MFPTKFEADGQMWATSRFQDFPQYMPTKKADDINTRMQIVQQTYLKQFTRLDTLLSSLSSTSAYLSQQIEALSNMNK